MKRISSVAGILIVSACTTTGGHEYPSDYHLYENLRSFRAPAIEQIEGQSYRLVWHAWHQSPGLILANCTNLKCMIEVRYTDGYGTYTQGTLERVRSTEISRSEFEEIGSAFERDGFWNLESHLRPNEPYLGVNDNAPDEGPVICLHAPSYYLEGLEIGQNHTIYRYCQNNYDDGIQVAMPLIELAERHFPAEMGKIVAKWLKSKRESVQTEETD
uniref:hypothetical protein n=1 Tax=uncultured Altererythrobacter sp. TaxID=500840 RepID=UPI0026095A39|nr:hypothetical protein [uncultured Altererythrobacter sp.]